jgi:hypothetical protein
MKHCNWLDWDTDGNFVNVRPNNAIAGKPLISLSVGAGGFQFSHTMRPEQARALAQELRTLADEVEVSHLRASVAAEEEMPA